MQIKFSVFLFFSEIIKHFKYPKATSEVAKFSIVCNGFRFKLRALKGFRFAGTANLSNYTTHGKIFTESIFYELLNFHLFPFLSWARLRSDLKFRIYSAHFSAQSHVGGEVRRHKCLLIQKSFNLIPPYAWRSIQNDHPNAAFKFSISRCVYERNIMLQGGDEIGARGFKKKALRSCYPASLTCSRERNRHDLFKLWQIHSVWSFCSL